MGFLDTLWAAVQPIVNLRTGQVVGYEALVRGPQGSDWATPDAIWRQARRERLSRELEDTCWRIALQAGGRLLAPGQWLFVNVDLRHDGGPGRLDGDGPTWDKVAVEVSERQNMIGNGRALRSIQKWREAGHLIVVDDYCTGHASLGTVLAVQPDMIKIDRFLVAGMDTDPRRRVAVEAVSDLMKQMGVTVIAEGIETVGELEALREMGIEYGQGFLLGRPSAEPSPSPCRIVVEAGVTNSVVPLVTRGRDSVDRPSGCGVVLDLFHQALFDNVDRAVYYVDRRRTILGWNRKAEEVSGFSAAEVVGRRCMNRMLDHIDEAGTPLCQGLCPLVHAMHDGLPREDVVLLRHKLGHRVRVAVQVTPVRDRDRRIVGAIEVFAPIAVPHAAARTRLGNGDSQPRMGAFGSGDVGSPTLARSVAKGPLGVRFPCCQAGAACRGAGTVSAGRGRMGAPRRPDAPTRVVTSGCSSAAPRTRPAVRGSAPPRIRAGP